MSPRGHQQSPADQKAEARSSAVEKVEQAEAEKGLDPGKGVGQSLHQGYKENA